MWNPGSSQAVTLALHNAAKQAPLLALLGTLAESGFVSANQLAKVGNPGQRSSCCSTIIIIFDSSHVTTN